MWYLWTALVLVAGAVVVIVTARHTASHPFRCRHCGKTFSIKWTKVLTTIHSGNDYKLECPHCKTKDWCTQQPKSSKGE